MLATLHVHISLETTPLPQHRMYCITGTWKGLVDMPKRFRISPQESWGTYFVCTSYGVRLNFVIASRLIKRYPAIPANIARSLSIHSRDTKTVWHVDQTFPRAGDAIHPVLWKRCGFQTTYTWRHCCGINICSANSFRT